MLQSVGTYLKYAKDKYQAEPDYFSFNESNIGVDVLQTAEEHRDGIKRLGATFEKLGLKTRVLLGDCTGPRNTQAFCLPAAQDPEAMKYVAAVAFHSWGGATPQQYAAWGDLAEQIKRPLIVAEAGVDAFAWRTRSYADFPYAVREMVHYQELLLHARPQQVLLWEYTGDYSLMSSRRAVKGQPVMTERFCLQKHWTDLTPAGAQALGSTSEGEGILATAFRVERGGRRDYTVHLSNARWPREVTLTGLPAEVKAWRVVRTAEGVFYQEQPTAAPSQGKLTLTLPAESLTSLTTLELTPAVPLP